MSENPYPITSLTAATGKYVRHFNHAIAATIGLEPCLLLQHLLCAAEHFEQRGLLVHIEDRDWFFRAEEQLLADVYCSSRKTLARFVNQLEDLGVIKTIRHGTPFRRYFRVRESKVATLAEYCTARHTLVENPGDKRAVQAARNLLESSPRCVAHFDASLGVEPLDALLGIGARNAPIAGQGVPHIVQYKEDGSKDPFEASDDAAVQEGLPVEALPVRPRRRSPKPADGDKFAARARERHAGKAASKDHDHPLLQFWNTLPNVRHHTKPGTKARTEACRAIRELLSTGLAKKTHWDSTWRQRNGITAMDLERPWSTEQVRRAMSVVSDMFSDGHFPGPDSPLRKLDLAKIVYDGDVGKSMLTVARVRGKAETVRQKRTDTTVVQLDDDTHACMLELQGAVVDIRGGELLPGEEEDSVRVARALDTWFCSFEADTDVTSRWHDTGKLGEHYREWIVREYADWRGIRIGLLLPGRKIFAAFVNDMRDYFSPAHIPMPRSDKDPRAEE